ncbi:MAG: von Willebrand factor type [Rhodoferax sp.]|nr:von Willebrand factor type [Rhodoferax sp.]
MRGAGGLARAKGLLLTMLAEAYRRRERVALLCFGGDAVELRLSPRRAAGWNEAWVAPIGGGGGTPLALGVAAADRLLQRHGAGRRALWLMTDGRSREQPPRPAAVDAVTVLDFEAARVPLHRAERLATAWSAGYFRFGDIATAEVNELAAAVAAF